MSDIDIIDKDQLSRLEGTKKPDFQKSVITAEGLDLLEGSGSNDFSSLQIPPEIMNDLESVPRAPIPGLQEVWDKNAMGEKTVNSRILAEQLGMTEEEAFRNHDLLINQIPGTNGDAKKAHNGFMGGVKYSILQKELNDLSFQEAVGLLKRPEWYEARIEAEKTKEEPNKENIDKWQKRLAESQTTFDRIAQLQTDMSAMTPEEARWWMPQIGWTLGNVSSQMLQGMREGLVMSLGTMALGAAAGASAGGAGALPGAAAGLTFGIAGGMISYSARQEAGASWRTLIDRGVDPKIARPISFAVGAINGALEFIGDITIIKTLPGVDKALSQAAEGAVQTVIRNGTLKQIAAAGMKVMARTGAVESWEEVSQNTMSAIADYMAVELTNRYSRPKEEAALAQRLAMQGKTSEEINKTLKVWREENGILTHQQWRDFIKEQAATVIKMFPSAALLAAPGTAFNITAETVQLAKEKKAEGLTITEVIPEEAAKPKPITPEQRLQEKAKTFKTAPEFTEYVKKEILSEADLKEIGADKALFESRMGEYWNKAKEKKEEVIVPEATEETKLKTEAAISWVLQAQEAKREEATQRFKAKQGVEHTPLGIEIPKQKERDTLLHPESQVAILPSAKEVRKQMEESYEKVKDVFFKRRDKRIVLEIPNLKKKLQTEIKTKLGQKKYSQSVKDIDAAIQIYIDTKRNPSDIDRYYDLLTEEQRKVVDLSQNLPEGLQGVIDKIDKAYKEIGLESQEADVIHNTLENYTARIWDRKGEEAASIYRKFGTTSRHAKARVFDTIIEGWALGNELKVKSATNNLAILQEEMVKTIENKRFLKSMSRVKGIDGSPLITTKNLEGYKEIKHPNFILWKYAGKADPNEAYGKNFFVTDKGVLLEKQRLYAPQKIAKNLNNIFGTSALKEVPGVKQITKYNAIIKSWILQSSFFHHLAFMRSYYLGAGRKNFRSLSPRQAYLEGRKAIENMQEEIVLGVENGLTLGLMQDWDESLLQEKTAIERLLEKNKVTRAIADKISDLRQKHVDFLFSGFGAGLKAKSFLIEFQHEMKLNPNEDPNVVAKRVASLINDDFGGLHLERMGRNPTVQHIFRIFALAPDWTESNIRSMVKAFASGGAKERQMYQRFWARVLVRGAALTVFANFLMAGGDLDDFLENYRKAWQAGDLRWLDVDVTPIYKLFGGESDRRKYFSIFGHFKDPIKFILHPIKSAHYKGSVLYGTFYEVVSGADWAGRRFTTLKELLHTGETVKWGPGRPLSYEQIPSYILSQLKSMQPVQIQNIISWLNGEMEGFDAIANSFGFGVRTTYP